MDPWQQYHREMRLWQRLGEPSGLEPMRPRQEGPHIDTLPIEDNPRTVDVLLVAAKEVHNTE